MKLVILLSMAVAVITFYSLMAASAPRTEEERKREDEAQLDYIREWRKEHRASEKTINLF